MKSPSVAILGPAPSASSLPVASRLSDHVQRELKMIGDSPADLRTLVLGKQRQLEVEAAKLSKLSKTSKEEKLWLSSKIMELEEALRNVRGTEQVEQELEVARQDVSKLQEMASESEQKVHRLQREIERERAEAEEMKSALLRRVSEAISEPRSEKPARQFGGTRWVINRSEGKNCFSQKPFFSFFRFIFLGSCCCFAASVLLVFTFVCFFFKKSHFPFFFFFFQIVFFKGLTLMDICFWTNKFHSLAVQSITPPNLVLAPCSCQ